MQIEIPETHLPRVVIVGGGFAGLTLAKALRKYEVQTVLIDQNNYHAFPPLLYQVASADLEAPSIAFPFRKIFSQRKNFHFRMANVERIDTHKHQIITDIGEVDYDFAVMATGSQTNFFGMEGLQIRAMPMKSINEALDLRSMIFQNFEKALSMENERKKQSIMTYVIAGGGPTGVELAGALGEIKRTVLPREYPELNTEMMKIVLIQSGNRILPSFSEKASEKAKRFLEDLGVTIQLNSRVTDYFGDYIQTNDNQDLIARTLIWTAGVVGNPTEGLEEHVNPRSSRIAVDVFSRVKGHENVFALGDVAAMCSEAFPAGHPMVAPAAIQQAILLAKNIGHIQAKKELVPFEYKDKGAMATIGKNKAVVEVGKRSLQGTLAWYIWLIVHLLSLVGFNKKINVLVSWVKNYYSKNRGSGLILNPFDFSKEKKKRKKKLNNAEEEGE